MKKEKSVKFFYQVIESLKPSDKTKNEKKRTYSLPNELHNPFTSKKGYSTTASNLTALK